MSGQRTPVTGRFAPSPTGPLHLGSLVAALGSWMSARSRGGRWRLRMDDLDRARNVRGMEGHIRGQLERLGLNWDGPVLYQTARLDAYYEGLRALTGAGVTYPCGCSRREITADAELGPLGAVYRGTCREHGPPEGRDTALRLKLRPGRHAIRDRFAGACVIAHDRIGDVAVMRRNGTPAYHLVTTLDDAHLGVTEVVRGADLQWASVIQQELQHHLRLPAVAWAHLPVVLSADGRDKLSKQTGASALDPARDAVGPLLEAWRFLAQPPPPGRPDTPHAFLEWALPHWDESRIRPGRWRIGGSPDDPRSAPA